MIKKLKLFLYSFFREFLVFHHSSLEFRAKLIAAVIASNLEYGECEERLLKEIAHEIYKDDEIRAEVLINTVLEYIKKIKEQNDLSIDDLIIDIDEDLKERSKFYSKIDIEILERFFKCKASFEAKLLRLRVIEYLKNELKYKNYKNV